MFKRIVVAFDGTDGAERALERGIALAAASAAELLIIAAGRLPEYAETEGEVDEAKKQAESFYARHLSAAAVLADGAGVQARTKLVFGKPADQIVRVAAEEGADLVVLGVHPHHPLRRRILGATADKVVDLAECSVLVVR